MVGNDRLVVTLKLKDVKIRVKELLRRLCTNLISITNKVSDKMVIKKL